MSRYRVNPETAELEDIEYIIDDKESIVDMIYPINSIYISMVNVNPSSYWEGTQWELLSDGYLRNNAAAATGGSENSGNTTLTTDQIPSHSHMATTSSAGNHGHAVTVTTIANHGHTLNYTTIKYATGASIATIPITYANTKTKINTSATGAHGHTATTNTVGSHTHTTTTEAVGKNNGHTHTIEPTYVRIYAYKRIA